MELHRSSGSMLLLSWTLLLRCQGPVNCSRANYEEPCDKSIRCDSLAALTCINGTCNCIKPDLMTYDPYRRACVALAGEKCKYTVVEEYRSWFEEVKCIDNSQCSTANGLCTCDQTFMELNNGSCIPRRTYGQQCKMDSECRKDMHLTCVDSECKCDQENAIFSYAHSQCVGLADKPCLNDLCTANALCRGYYGTHSMDSYEEYSGEDTKCICSPGYTMSPKGMCQVSHGGSCNFRDSHCLDNFKCQDGSCVCRYKGHQVYEEAYQDCYSLVGGPCTHQKAPTTLNMNTNASTSMIWPIYCIKPALCVQTGRYRTKCVCPEGTIENEERRCELTYGRICQTDKERGNSAMKCDQLAPLYCISGKCQCEDDLKFYNQTAKRCQGLVGSECEISNAKFCIDGAYCQQHRGSITKGQCQCMEKYQETLTLGCQLEEANE